ncbi:hypothetical protein [Aurantiacibacter sediminis]|uniref:Uncharacterized protein n=1 Tax=Aurantiacibacter sediminis TaxID=2793064 RepID=A0ABS0N1U7_9SPHN|nr:hypothetical protein [Aurantiacibacter sediminis]MBH5321938.1 hypothetical protein [Aurantiacibacter sediminis]
MNKTIQATFHEASSHGEQSRFLRKRGKLDLSHDRSGHRRFAWLYEDMLT